MVDFLEELVNEYNLSLPKLSENEAEKFKNEILSIATDLGVDISRLFAGPTKKSATPPKNDAQKSPTKRVSRAKRPASPKKEKIAPEPKKVEKFKYPEVEGFKKTESSPPYNNAVYYYKKKDLNFDFQYVKGKLFARIYIFDKKIKTENNDPTPEKVIKLLKKWEETFLKEVEERKSKRNISNSLVDQFKEQLNKKISNNVNLKEVISVSHQLENAIEKKAEARNILVKISYKSVVNDNKFIKYNLKSLIGVYNLTFNGQNVEVDVFSTDLILGDIDDFKEDKAKGILNVDLECWFGYGNEKNDVIEDKYRQTLEIRKDNAKYLKKNSGYVQLPSKVKGIEFYWNKNNKNLKMHSLNTIKFYDFGLRRVSDIDKVLDKANQILNEVDWSKFNEDLSHSEVQKYMSSAKKLEKEIDVVNKNIPARKPKKVKEKINTDVFYIDFLNKEKGFKKDRIYFFGEGSGEKAKKWGEENIENFKGDMVTYLFAYPEEDFIKLKKEVSGLANKPKRTYKKASGLSNKVVNHLKGAKQVATNKKLTFSQKLRKLLEY